jgi:hypothetical protein
MKYNINDIEFPDSTDTPMQNTQLHDAAQEVSAVQVPEGRQYRHLRQIHTPTPYATDVPNPATLPTDVSSKIDCANCVLTGEVLTSFKEMLNENCKAFVRSETDLGYNSQFPVLIRLRDNAVPIYSRPYRLNPQMVLEAHKHRHQNIMSHPLLNPIFNTSASYRLFAEGIQNLQLHTFNFKVDVSFLGNKAYQPHVLKCAYIHIYISLPPLLLKIE